MMAGRIRNMTAPRAEDREMASNPRKSMAMHNPAATNFVATATIGKSSTQKFRIKVNADTRARPLNRQLATLSGRLPLTTSGNTPVNDVLTSAAHGF